jgi:hypothetical protein
MNFILQLYYRGHIYYLISPSEIVLIETCSIHNVSELDFTYFNTECGYDWYHRVV